MFEQNKINVIKGVIDSNEQCFCYDFISFLKYASYLGLYAYI